MSEARTEALPEVVAPVARLELRVIEGPDDGQSITFDRLVLVGTSENADLRLSDPTVSRRHFAIQPAPGGARLRDTESRNGTSVGAVRVHDVEIPVGTEITAGTTRLVVSSTFAEVPPTERRPRASKAAEAGQIGRFVGRAAILEDVYANIERAAATSTTILIEGESGTGKELLAEAVHESGPRSNAAFVTIDCGAIPENLIESELFGHERGAFTGAEKERAGAFELADGGTLFLDEVGELPLAMQTRLLRALDRREVRRLGSSVTKTVDVHVVAATNRSLEREVEEGRFRPDLYHRIAVVLVRVPPLRERIGDVELLARRFVENWKAPVDRVLSPDVLDRLRRHHWPGNVRELRNQVERLVLLGDMDIRSAALSRGSEAIDPATAGLAYREARALAIDTFSRRYAEDMLKRHGGNVSAAARTAGIARRHFQRLKEE